MFRFLLPFIVILISASSAYSQNNCNCPQQQELTESFKTFTQKNDLAGAKQFWNSLDAKYPASCKVMIGNLLMNMEFKMYDTTGLRNTMLKTESLIETNCISGINANFQREKARYYYLIEKTDSALTLALNGVKYCEAGNLKKNETGFLTLIAQIMFGINEPAKAVLYQKKCAMLTAEVDQDNASIAFGNLGAMYGYMFDQTKDERYLDSVILVLNTSNFYLRKINNNKEQIVDNYTNMAQASSLRKNYKAAFQYCDSAIHSEYISPESKMSVYNALSNIYSDSGDKLHTLQYADSSYHYALLTGKTEETVLTMKALYEACKLNGDTGRALRIFEKMVTIRDSLNKSERIAAITEIEEKFNKSKNEETIRNLEGEKKISALNIRLLTAGIISAVLIILLVVIFFRQKNLKNKQSLLETEQRLNRARMNPHFFFNTLAALQTSALKEKDPVKLADLLAMYSKIMRNTLESTYTDLITIEEEINYLELYLKLQQFRTNGNFVFSIEFPDEIPVSELKIPGMLIQPFIENSIEHGFAGITGEGKISISFAQTSATIEIKITDNGTGMKKSHARRDHKSRATEITRDRLFLLSSKYNSKARFDIHDNTNGTGTTVDITLPLIY